MTDRRMFRHAVPVDSNSHPVSLSGEVRRVAAVHWVPGSGVGPEVEFWAENDPAAPGRERLFQVFGTGHPLPENSRWRGTTERTPEGLVWHLYEVEAQ